MMMCNGHDYVSISTPDKKSQATHLHLQAWNESEAARENNLNTYAAMRSDGSEKEDIQGTEEELFRMTTEAQITEAR